MLSPQLLSPPLSCHFCSVKWYLLLGDKRHQDVWGAISYSSKCFFLVVQLRFYDNNFLVVWKWSTETSKSKKQNHNSKLALNKQRNNKTSRPQFSSVQVLFYLKWVEVFRSSSVCLSLHSNIIKPIPVYPAVREKQMKHKSPLWHHYLSQISLIQQIKERRCSCSKNYLRSSNSKQGFASFFLITKSRELTQPWS